MTILNIKSTDMKTYSVTSNTKDKEFNIHVRGDADMDSYIRYRRNVPDISYLPMKHIKIKNLDTKVLRNPKITINDKFNWNSVDNIIKEFSEGIEFDQELVYTLWEKIRKNTSMFSPQYHVDFHDPVKFFNTYGGGLCDDFGNNSAMIFERLSIPSRVVKMKGHVQCEVMASNKWQYFDMDYNTFFLDKNNKLPMSCKEMLENPDLVDMELQKGPDFTAWETRKNVDFVDRLGKMYETHEAKACVSTENVEYSSINYHLRPDETITFYWRDLDKYSSGKDNFNKRPRLFTNSLLEFPVNEKNHHYCVLNGLTNDGNKFTATRDNSYIIIPVQNWYNIAGCTLYFNTSNTNVKIYILHDNIQKWKAVDVKVGEKNKLILDNYFEFKGVYNRPFHKYDIRIVVEDETVLEDIKVETHLQSAMLALPRLSLGDNKVNFTSMYDNKVNIELGWEEVYFQKQIQKSIKPISPIGVNTDDYVTFTWEKIRNFEVYHFILSRNPDFKYPFRPCTEVHIRTNEYKIPYKNVFTKGEKYYWKVRFRDCRSKTWCDWSEPVSFVWDGKQDRYEIQKIEKDESFIPPIPDSESDDDSETTGDDENVFNKVETLMVEDTHGEFEENLKKDDKIVNEYSSNEDVVYIESDASDDNSDEDTDTRPGKPLNVKLLASNMDDGEDLGLLQWTENPDGKTEYYKVYYDEGDGYLEDNVIQVFDNNIEVPLSNKYSVVSVDKNENESIPSTYVI